MSSSAKAWSSRRNVFKPTTISHRLLFRRTHPGLIPLTINSILGRRGFGSRDSAIREDGHRGVVMSPDYEKIRLPSRSRTPIGIRSSGLARISVFRVSFHVGIRCLSRELQRDGQAVADVAEVVKFTTLGNGRQREDRRGALPYRVCVSATPRLNFVSIESGVGWLPFFMESLDWQWKNIRPRRRDIRTVSYRASTSSADILHLLVRAGLIPERRYVPRRQHHVRERLSTPH
jgi:hypothetical protein